MQRKLYYDDEKLKRMSEGKASDIRFLFYRYSFFLFVARQKESVKYLPIQKTSCTKSCAAKLWTRNAVQERI